MKHILIIDDDEAIRLVFSELLTEAGYTVHTACDGMEGINYLKKQGADLVVTDIMMPEMDGLEVLQTIRRYDASLPVIAISGGMRERPISFLPHAKKMGACLILEKPVGMSALLKGVQDTIGVPD